MQLQDALRIVLDAAEPPGVVRLPVTAAAGRVAVADVVARADAPAQPRAVTDGYLVRPGDCAGASSEAPVSLELAAMVVGGDERPRLRRGRAWPVATGAAVPQPDLAVLPPSAVERRPGQVLVRRPPAPGLNILPAGGAITRNEVILAAGEVITPPAVGAMTAGGISEVDVFRRPRVMVVGVGSGTGEPWGAADDGDHVPGEGDPGAGERARPGDGTLAMLVAAVTQAGCDVVHACSARPDPAALASIFRRAVGAGIDVLLTAGGISPRAGGPVAEAWREAGGQVVVDSLESRPGRSFLAGIHTDMWLIALSPAPASSLAVFTVLVRPFLLRLAGRQRVVPPVVRARLTAPCPCDGHYPRLVWARLHGQGPFTVEPAIDPVRGRMYYPMNANALILLPPGPGALSSNQFAWTVPLGVEGVPGGVQGVPGGAECLPLQAPRPLVFGVAGPASPARAAVLERLAQALAAQGLQVAQVRRVPQGFSWSLGGDAAAGGGRVAAEPAGRGNGVQGDASGNGARSEWLTLVGPQANLLYEASDLPGGADEDRLGRLLDRLTTTRHVPDVVLVEGFSGTDLPKVWVGPAHDDVEVANVAAVVRTPGGALHLPGVPVFLDDDARPLVEHVLGTPGAGEEGDDDDVF
ncbi:MAG TPA: molybdopterin-binding protein [Bacillota bacterium]